MTATYMRILIHTMNESLFPDADPLTTVWTGPSTEIVTVQCPLYASLATSLFAAFVAMLGKQWVNRYIRNRGGSAREKSWERQRKLDGMKQWNFQVIIEAIPVMLQIALVLLGSGLSLYLWSINRIVAGIVMAVTLFGISFYAFLTLAATLVYNCPYQTPPSLAMRSLVRYVTRNHRRVIYWLSSIFSILYHTRLAAVRLLKYLCLGILTLSHAPSSVVVPRNMPLAVLVQPAPLFHDSLIDLMSYEADARCVAWVLYSTTDNDVILSSVRFASDIVLYPSLAAILPTHVLVDLLFECIFEWEILPGKSDQARSVGMALASVLSVQLCLDPESQQMEELRERIASLGGLRVEDTVLMLVVDILCSVAGPRPRLLREGYLANPRYPNGGHLWQLTGSQRPVINIPFKFWMSRVILQTIWRWRQALDPGVIISMSKIKAFFLASLEHSDPLPIAIKTTIVLTLAIALGQSVGLDDLYVPDTKCALSSRTVFNNLRNEYSQALLTAFNLLHRRMIYIIGDDSPHRRLHDINPLLSILYLLDLSTVGMGSVSLAYITWMEGIICSDYHTDERYDSAKLVMRLLEKPEGLPILPPSFNTYAPTLLRFLGLCEDRHRNEHPFAPTPEFRMPSQPGLEIFALQILRSGSREEDTLSDLAPMFVSMLTRVLGPGDRLQSRALGLELFAGLWRCWPSLPPCEGITAEMCALLVHAIGDPLELSETQVEAFASTNEQERRGDGIGRHNTLGILLGFAISDAWRDHLRPPNFASCAGIITREGDRREVLNALARSAKIVTGSAETRVKSAMVIKGLDRLKGMGNYGAVQLMLLHIWSSNEYVSFDEESWKLLERETHEYFHTHGMEDLEGFAAHIREGGSSRTTVATNTFRFRGADGVQRRVRTKDWGERSWVLGWGGRVSDFFGMCRVKGLYQVVGWDPTRKEGVIDR